MATGKLHYNISRGKLHQADWTFGNVFTVFNMHVARRARWVLVRDGACGEICKQLRPRCGHRDDFHGGWCSWTPYPSYPPSNEGAAAQQQKKSHKNEDSRCCFMQRPRRYCWRPRQNWWARRSHWSSRADAAPVYRIFKQSIEVTAGTSIRRRTSAIIARVIRAAGAHRSAQSAAAATCLGFGRLASKCSVDIIFTCLKFRWLAEEEGSGYIILQL